MSKENISLFNNCISKECLIISEDTRFILLDDFLEKTKKGFGEGYIGIIVCKSQEELNLMIRNSATVFYSEAGYNKSNMFWMFRNGEILKFHLDSKDRGFEQFHGHEYSYIGFQDLNLHKDSYTYDSLNYLCRCSRSDKFKKKKKNFTPIIRSTLEPYHIPDWIYGHFLNHGELKGGEGKDRRSKMWIDDTHQVKI